METEVFEKNELRKGLRKLRNSIIGDLVTTINKSMAFDFAKFTSQKRSSRFLIKAATAVLVQGYAVLCHQ